MAEKKYYWLKLKEDFFEEDTIQWLEEQENGIYYSNFYLKLCLKSLKTDGILIRNVGEILIPYDISKLADMAHVNKDTAIVAMELFKKIGLVQVLENGEIFLTQLKNMVGSETSKAALMRKKREKDKLVQNKGNNVTKQLLNCYTEIEIEKETRDKDKDKDKEIDKSEKSSIVVSNVEVFKHFEKCGFIVTPMLMEKISADVEIYGSKNMIDAATEAMERGKLNNYKYVVGIIQNWQTEGRDSKKSTKTIKNEPKPLRFNNFESREYDYDDLENKLLGWEDEDNEHRDE